MLVPYKMPQKLLNRSPTETGVKVNYVVTGWDATHTKLVVANTAKHLHRRRGRVRLVVHRPVRRRQVGGAAGRPAAGKPLLADLTSTDAAFKSGGKTYAACYSNDFRISMYNKKMFAKAGITSFPTHVRRARRPTSRS